MQRILFLFFVLQATVSSAQTKEVRFQDAFGNLLEDPSFRHATISLYLKNETTGKTVTDHNSEIGVAPASCQKVITATTSFALLGQDYRYATTLGYTGKINNGVLHGNIVIRGSGDPTLGSWRYEETKEDHVIDDFKNAVLGQRIHSMTGHVYADERLWDSEVTPDGWIWQDIGNYYGAGARPLNWRENQYDLYLKSGSHVGDPVEIAGTKPPYVYGLRLRSKVTSGAKGSGDNNYIYLPLGNRDGFVRGTTPVDEDHFTISGAMPDPGSQLAITLEAALKHEPVETAAGSHPGNVVTGQTKTIFTHYSPLLKDIVLHFLRRSINLYGEALIKTLALQFTGTGNTDSGVAVIHRFWKERGIEPYAINIIDGSGLSPSNRVTTKALVTVMEYAAKQSWFPSFYDALPTISGIKMKSGSINGVISYTGYLKGTDGNQYTFSFVINNYDGNGDAVRHKMWLLLGMLQ